MVTLPIWLLVLIGIFGFPIFAILLTLIIYFIKLAIIVINELSKELF